jgi:hypothetical protein
MVVETLGDAGGGLGVGGQASKKKGRSHNRAQSRQPSPMGGPRTGLKPGWLCFNYAIACDRAVIRRTGRPAVRGFILKKDGTNREHEGWPVVKAEFAPSG